MVYSVFLCTFAALSTAIGGLAAVLIKNITNKHLSFAQGFAGAVMLTVSLFDMIPFCYKNALEYLSREYALGGLMGLFVSGWVIGALLESFAAPEINQNDKQTELYGTTKRLMIITTAVVALHNLPEGMLTIFSGMENPKFGLKMALAVAMHNIPEGIAVAVPAMFVKKSRIKAFLQSFYTGLAELAGGVIMLFLLKDFVNPNFINGLLGIVSGIMCQTSVCQLIPSAVKISQLRYTIYGVAAGVVAMSIGLFII